MDRPAQRLRSDRAVDPEDAGQGPGKVFPRLQRAGGGQQIGAVGPDHLPRGIRPPDQRGRPRHHFADHCQFVLKRDIRRPVAPGPPLVGIGIRQGQPGQPAQLFRPQDQRRLQIRARTHDEAAFARQVVDPGGKAGEHLLHQAKDPEPWVGAFSSAGDHGPCGGGGVDERRAVEQEDGGAGGFGEDRGAALGRAARGEKGQRKQAGQRDQRSRHDQAEGQCHIQDHTIYSNNTRPEGPVYQGQMLGDSGLTRR